MAITFIFSANMESPEFETWKKIDRVVHGFACSTLEWKRGGYEGIAKIVKDEFDIELTRENNSHVQYKFKNEEDFLIFKLRWL